MRDILLAHEPAIRVAAFGGVFVVMAAWEFIVPRRRQAIGRGWRWPNNLGVVALDAVLVRVLFPTTAVGLALLAEARGFGLLNLVALPAWAAVPAAVVVLDLAIYLQHVLFHAVPALWRLHRMHHADLEFDVSTGLRFHPIEIVLSMLIKLTVIAALGAPALAVLLFEVALNATSMFNHGNVRIPPALDRVLRWLVVTPDMHRVHHSILARETNSNFGFNLPWWDRLFGTYRAQPAAGHDGMTIGIEQFRDARELGLDRMLLQPFRSDAGRYPLGYREAERRARGGGCRDWRSRCCSRRRSGGRRCTATGSMSRCWTPSSARSACGRRQATSCSMCWAPSPSFPAPLSRLPAVRCLDRSGEASGTLPGPRWAPPLPSWSRAISPGTGSRARPADCSGA
jgi:sterol desaturase/sphingolipid hydroxylase (fatty acid hydroxylase superfamily)